MLKIGILGAGRAAAAHADGITRSGLGQVTKVYAPGDGAAVAPRYGARPAQSADEILQDAAIDAVVIASPTDTHLGYLRQALAAGKHVLCEVPLARTAADLDEIEQLLGKPGDRVAAASLLARFDAPITHLRTVVGAGDLGEIGTIRLGNLSPFRAGEDGWYGDFAKSGGVVLSKLPHLIDAVRFCFGEVTRLHALRGPGSNDLSHDYVLLVARTGTGAIVHLEASWAESGKESHTYYEVAGSQGILEFDTRMEPKITVQVKKTAEPLTSANGETASPFNSAPSTPYQLLAVDFLQAISAGRAPAAPLQDALTATRMALAALESAENGTVLAAAR